MEEASKIEMWKGALCCRAGSTSRALGRLLGAGPGLGAQVWDEVPTHTSVEI